MANYIPVNAAAQTGADFTLASNESVTLLLIDGTTNQMLPAGVNARVMIKTSGSNYMLLGQLTAQNPAMCLESPGTYQVRTSAGCGVDKT